MGKVGVWVESGSVGGKSGSREFGWSVGVVGGNVRSKCRIVVQVFV